MSTAVNNRPLVTLVLLAYNQEKFVREAVEGAFAQTYSPLEVILSDDCSNDRTFEIMRQMAAAYQGPHRIALNRNAINLGIGGHLNRVVELARGSYIATAAGDDISLPCRIATLARQFTEKTAIVYSSALSIDEAGATTGRVSIRPHPNNATSLRYRVSHYCGAILGSTNCFQKRVFHEFGPLLPTTIAEDCALAFRAYALGEVCFIDEDLVKYRLHKHNIWGIDSPVSPLEWRGALCRRASIRRMTYLQIKHDLAHPEMAVRFPGELDASKGLCQKRIKETEIEQLILSNSPRERRRGIVRCLVEGIGHRLRIKLLVMGLLPTLYFSRLPRQSRTQMT
jgi:glycosyltransferase involved in cell wall biosynthesis